MKPLIPLVLLTVATATHAGVVKWIDSDGKVHYGDQAPADGSQVKKVKVPPPTASKKRGRTSEACGKVKFVDGIDPCNVPPGVEIVNANRDPDRDEYERQKAQMRMR